MEESASSSDPNPGNHGVDEEFKSCCEEDEDWQDAEESLPEGRVEGSEEFPLVIYQGQEGGDQSSSIISELLQEDLETSVMLLPEFGEILGESIYFSDGVEEIVSERSLTLLEGSNQDVVPSCLISLSEVHDEEVLERSLRLCEAYEDVVSLCSLGLLQDREEDASECSLSLSESEEGGILDCEFRLSLFSPKPFMNPLRETLVMKTMNVGMRGGFPEFTCQDRSTSPFQRQSFFMLF